MRYVVIGGGIVGLATAHRLTLEHPDAEVTVVEKERPGAPTRPATTPASSTPGVYYKPGSLKADAVPGRQRLDGGLLPRARHPAPDAAAS